MFIYSVISALELMTFIFLLKSSSGKFLAASAKHWTRHLLYDSLLFGFPEFLNNFVLFKMPKIVLALLSRLINASGLSPRDCIALT